MKLDRTMKIGIAIALAIAILAPVLASSNPDGLESTASSFPTADGKEQSTLEAPMPDYVIPAMGDGPASGALAIVLGTLLVLLLTFGAGRILSAKRAGNEGD